MTASKGLLRRWGPRDVADLKYYYPHMKNKDVAAILGRTTQAVATMASKLNLVKTEAFMGVMQVANAKRVRSTRFQRGLTPWNKGTKGKAGQHPNSRATQFRRGQRPTNEMPIGSYRVTWGGSSHLHRIVEMKVSNEPGACNRRWTPVHRIVWEAAHGPILPGHIVVFRPGKHTVDPERITVDILESISRAENARRNHPRSRDPELGRLIQLKSVITRHVNRIVREAKETAS